MRIHFIAIGGSAMHNLAIALHKKGDTVTGSDDKIFDPSRSRLAKFGLLPLKDGWFVDKITSELDVVILGMHAKSDNPELLKAKQLGLPVYSFPEFLYEHAKNKKRVVIGGSHGKTTITAMIMQVLNHHRIDADFLVGAQLEGFDVMVRLTDHAPVMIFEGDEYLTSPLDPRPKFHVYKPELALISGIAWDHINVFPTFEEYVEQFRIFIDMIPKDGKLVYCEDDHLLTKLAEDTNQHIEKIGYDLPPHIIDNGITYLTGHGKNIPLKVFGSHNLLNLNAAWKICRELGVDRQMFYDAISSFHGASNRLEFIDGNDYTAVYKDFAHSPSKLVATTKAVKEQFPDRKLVACIELHTFSSLNKGFLEQYRGTMRGVDFPIVYYNPLTIALKRLPDISKEMIVHSFNHPAMKVYTNSKEVLEDLINDHWKNKNLLMMSSGDFDGINFQELAKKILRK
ncbi:MAG: peptidoglycan synthetase [Bacteroidales bacterium]|nr:peptidoglycan synthetase [Bacteroidales bacterium]